MNGIIDGYIKNGITYVKFREINISQSLNNTLSTINTGFDMEFTATERG